MPDIGLTSEQLAVICALSSGVTTLAAAEQAGVHRNTISNWRRNQLPFQRALAEAQYDRALYYREKIEDMVDLAVQTLHDLLADPKTPASVRLKAALAILTTAATPPDPKKQIELIVETVTAPAPMHNPAQSEPPKPQRPVVHNSAQPAPTAEALETPLPPAPVHNSAQPEDAQSTPAPLHKTAQPEPRKTAPPLHTPAQAPRRSDPSAIARNHACPCRSGKKYKRCCMNKLADAA